MAVYLIGYSDCLTGLFGSTDLIVVQTAMYLISYSDYLTGLFGSTDLVVL